MKRSILFAIIAALPCCSTDKAAAEYLPASADAVPAAHAFTCATIAFMAEGDATTADFNFQPTMRCVNDEEICLIGKNGALSCVGRKGK